MRTLMHSHTQCLSCVYCRAVGLGSSGRLYVGVNLEFARLPVNNSVHAEQFLVVNALHHQERGLTKLAVSEAPCGHCRQFYSELCCAVSWTCLRDSQSVVMVPHKQQLLLRLLWSATSSRGHLKPPSTASSGCRKHLDTVLEL